MAPELCTGWASFLRLLDWEQGHADFPADVDIATAPDYPIRGHQLGYRNKANSYDAWDVEQYEQYIRELSFFGAKCNRKHPRVASTGAVDADRTREDACRDC